MSYVQTLSNLSLVQSLRKTSLVVTGWLCTIGGLVADVLQPIAPFAFYLFVASAVGLVVVAFLYWRGNKDLLGPLALAGIAAALFGFLSLLQQGGESQEQGILATAIPGIENLQERLGIIDRKLDDIKGDTQTIVATTARLESNSETIMTSLEAIKAGSDSGGIIKNPESPEDYYHNARVQELSGDYAAARRSYLEYFKSDLPILDPHLRFISFLKVQEGTAGARETYNAVTARSASPIPAYARILLLNPAQRIAGLTRYFEENPAFGPAPYHLSLEFSEVRLGSQTIADKRQELAYLIAFQEIDENGGLLRYMVDQELVSEWRQDAQARRLTLESSLGNALENPVSLSWMSHNAGWNGNIQIGESVQDIKWNIKGKTQPVSTGSSGQVDPSTGKPAPRTFFSLPSNQGNALIEIRYTDLAGAEQGPFEFDFEAKKASADSNRNMLEMTSTSWVSFRDYDRKVLLYFSHLMVYRGALSKIQYGVDREVPNKDFSFPNWNKTGLATIDANTKVYITVPRSTSYVTVQLTYKNGDKSPITRFDRN
tara:strand:- start:277280 stop:278908 length:1629 start_codon:yes stop_codon:yes gene_type:complete